MEELKTAACYIRVSTDDQTEYSPDSQLKLLRDYAKGHSLILPDEFIFMEKEGVSGRKADKRPEFQRMIGIAKSKDHPFDTILVWKFSRFARNQEESIVYKSMLHRECGVSVVSISEPLADGPFGGLIERIIEWMDEYYSIRLSGEVHRGMEEAVSRGNPVNGAPFGFIRKDRQLLPDPDRIAYVQKIFRWYLDGLGCRQIALRLNDLGIRSKYGNPMENRTIEYILRNPVYIGKLRWGKDGWFRRDFDNPTILVFEGKHEPIIDLDTWEAVQRKLRESKERYGPRQRQTSPKEYFLRGMLRCSNCGGTLTYSNSGGVQCANYNRSSCKVSHFVSIKKAQEAVLQALCDDLLCESPTVDFETRSLPHASAQEQDPTGQLVRQEQRKLDRVREAYENGVDTLAEYRENKRKIQARIAALEASRPVSVPPEALRQAFAEKAHSVMKVVLDPASTDAERNDSLRSIVDHITFHRQTATFTLFYYL